MKFLCKDIFWWTIYNIIWTMFGFLVGAGITADTWDYWIMFVIVLILSATVGLKIQYMYRDKYTNNL